MPFYPHLLTFTGHIEQPTEQMGAESTPPLHFSCCLPFLLRSPIALPAPSCVFRCPCTSISSLNSVPYSSPILLHDPCPPLQSLPTERLLFLLCTLSAQFWHEHSPRRLFRSAKHSGPAPSMEMCHRPSAMRLSRASGAASSASLWPPMLLREALTSTAWIWWCRRSRQRHGTPPCCRDDAKDRKGWGGQEMPGTRNA